MSEINLIKELVGPLLVPSMAKKKGKKKDTVSRSSRVDDADSRRLPMNSYSNSFRSRRDALLHQLDIFTQLSVAKLRRKKINRQNKQLNGGQSREPEQLFTETHVTDPTMTASGRHEQKTAQGSCKPYNESKLLSFEPILKKTKAEIQPILLTRGSSRSSPRPQPIQLKIFKQFIQPQLENTPKLQCQDRASQLYQTSYRLKRSSIVRERASMQTASQSRQKPLLRIKADKSEKHSVYDRQPTYESRLSDYKLLIQIIHHCNAVYLDTVFPAVLDHRQRVIEVCVGKGNNCSLIKKLIRKRWWLHLTDTATSNTQFLWTQIKNKGFLLGQKTRPYYQLQEKFVSKNPTGMDSHYCKLMHPTQLQRQQSSKLQVRRQPPRLLNPLQKIHNHLQFSGFIGNKKSLLKCLLIFYSFHKVPQEDWSIPLTFHVDWATPQSEGQYQKFKQSHNGKMWLVKPGQNSNRGNGIIVSNSLYEINSKIKERGHSYIIQQYICPLLLYNQRKFDIRAYCLLTQTNGVLRAYVYEQGYIRTSSELFQMEPYNDPYIHLTNDAVQKHGPNYGRYEIGNKLSYQEMSGYLREKGHGQQSMDFIRKQMKAIMTSVVKSSYLLLDPNCRQNNFQLFGTDFLVDANLKVWLLEFNTNPCLETSAPVLERLLPRMLDNVLTICVDSLLAAPNSRKPFYPDIGLKNNRFELIWDSQFDRDQQYQQFLLKQNKQDSLNTD